MNPLSRVAISTVLALTWPAAHAADGQKIFTQGGRTPLPWPAWAVMALMAKALLPLASRAWPACQLVTLVNNCRTFAAAAASSR